MLKSRRELASETRFKPGMMRHKPELKSKASENKDTADQQNSTSKEKKSQVSGSFHIPELKLRTIIAIIVGDTPLIVHNWSHKSKLQMYNKQTQRAVAGREKKDPDADFEAALYRLEDGGYGFPSCGVKAAMVTACTSIGKTNITKIAARQAFMVMGEAASFQGVYTKAILREEMIRVQGSEPVMREDMVRVGQGVADLRYRPQFYPWFAEIHIRYNANCLSGEQIVMLLNTAGFAVGLGEWRPDRDGQKGMFHVATGDEVEELRRQGAI